MPSQAGLGADDATGNRRRSANEQVALANAAAFSAICRGSWWLKSQFFGPCRAVLSVFGATGETEGIR